MKWQRRESKSTKKNTIVKNGRQQEKEPEIFYETWCEIGNLYGRELYEALDKRLENTIIFEVRYCQRIKEMQRSLKLFFVEYEGEKNTTSMQQTTGETKSSTYS